jgi:hypothetical protein
MKKNTLKALDPTRGEMLNAIGNRLHNIYSRLTYRYDWKESDKDNCTQYELKLDIKELDYIQNQMIEVFNLDFKKVKNEKIDNSDLDLDFEEGELDD